MPNKTKHMQQIERHLHDLTVAIGARPTGSAANRRAADYLAQAFARHSFQVEQQSFTCLDWEQGTAVLSVAGRSVPVQPSPYSLPGDVQADVVAVATVAQLAAADLAGNMALLRGELAQEALMPKNFNFYNPDHHQQIIRLLEEKRPAAILTVSLHDSHFIPVFEDGDFDIPTAVILPKDETAVSAGQPVQLQMNSRRRQATGANVIARHNAHSPRRFVVTAHFDTKPGTPGALDNAAGVAVLLALAAILKEAAPADVGLELVAFNGEDYFSAAGQMAYLGAYRDTFDAVRLAINCDGVGLKHSKIGVAPMAGAADVAGRIAASGQAFANVETMAPWYQGDHMIFVIAQTPALAITSTGIFDLIDTVIHTEHDTLELVDPALIMETACFIQDVIRTLA